MLHSSAGNICYALHSVYGEKYGWHVQSYECTVSNTIRNGHVQLTFAEDDSRVSAKPKDVIRCPSHVPDADLRRAAPEEFEKEVHHARAFCFPEEPYFKVQPQNRNHPPTLFWHSETPDGPYIMLLEKGIPVMLSLRNNKRLLSPREELKHLLVRHPFRRARNTPRPLPVSRSTTSTTGAKRQVPDTDSASPDPKRRRCRPIDTDMGVFDVDFETRSRGVSNPKEADRTWPAHLRSQQKLEVPTMDPRLAVKLHRERFLTVHRALLHMCEDNRCFLHVGVVDVRKVAAKAARVAADAHAEVSRSAEAALATVSLTIAASASAAAAQAATNASAAVQRCLVVHARVAKLQSAICAAILQKGSL